MPILAPIVTALSAALVAAIPGLPVLAAQAIVSIGLSVAGYVIMRALTPSLKPPGQEFEVKAGANIPLFCVYGRQKLQGLIMPAVQTADRVMHVRVLGAGWHDAIEAIIIDGQRLRFIGIEGQWSSSGSQNGIIPGNGPGVPAGADPPWTPGLQAAGPSGSAWATTLEFGDNLRVKFYDGRPDQIADPSLVASTQTDAQGRAFWSAQHRGGGVCYAIIDIKPESKMQLSANPQIEFVLRGRRLWDPRKDPLYGGTGAHSRADMATWEWSDNAALAATDYRLGLWLGGRKVFGVGTPISRIRMDSRIAAANVCDTPRPLLDGREEPMWRIAAVVSGDRVHRDNLQIFYDAMAGWETERGGTYRLVAGGPQTAVAAITDADLVKGPRKYRAKKPRSDRFNAVAGKYADPLASYELQDLPLRSSSADEAADGGERMDIMMTLSQVPSHTQAQHLMEIARRRQRLQATATITVPPRLRGPEAMDVISWASSYHGGAARQFEIRSWRKQRSMAIEWGLYETSPDIWDWDPELDQLDPLEAADLPSAADRLSEVPGFAVTQATEYGDGGQAEPVFIVTWTPIDDATVDAVMVRYRPVGASRWAQARFDGSSTLAAGEGKIAGGIQADTPYEFEADLITTPPRATTVATTPSPVTSGPEHVVKGAVVAGSVDDGAIALPSFDDAARDALLRAHDLVAEMRARVDELAAISMGIDGLRARGAKVLQERIVSESGRARAELTRTAATLAEETRAVAQVAEELRAEIEDPTTGLGALAEAQEATETRVEQTEQGLSAVSTTVSNHTVQIGNLGGEMDLLEGQIATKASNSRVEAVEVEVDAQGQAISALSGRTSTLETQMGDAQSSLGDIQATMVDEDGARAVSQEEMIARLGQPGQPGSIEAQVSSTAAAVADLDEALATYEQETTAALGDLSADGLIQMAQIVSPGGGAVSGARMLVKATDSGLFAEAGLEMVALAGQGPAPKGRLMLVGGSLWARDGVGGAPFQVLDVSGRVLAPALMPGSTVRVVSYDRDAAATGFVPIGTGATSGGSNAFREQLLGSLDLLPNTEAISGASGSKVPLLATMNFAMEINSFTDSGNNVYYYPSFRLVARPQAGGPDVVICGEKAIGPSFYQTGNGFTSSAWAWGLITNLNAEAVRDFRSSVVAAGLHSVYVQWRWAAGAPNGLPDSQRTVRFGGNFSVYAFIR